jgi:hypothetical protein
MLFGCLLQDKLNTIFKLLIHFKYASWVSKSRKIYSIIDSLTSGGPLDIVFALIFSTNWNLKICSLISVSHWFIVYYICIQHSSDLVCLRIGHMSVSKWYIVDREGWICRWLETQVLACTISLWFLIFNQYKGISVTKPCSAIIWESRFLLFTYLFEALISLFFDKTWCTRMVGIPSFFNLVLLAKEGWGVRVD